MAKVRFAIDPICWWGPAGAPPTHHLGQLLTAKLLDAMKSAPQTSDSGLQD